MAKEFPVDREERIFESIGCKWHKRLCTRCGYSSIIEPLCHYTPHVGICEICANHGSNVTRIPRLGDLSAQCRAVERARVKWNT